MKSQRVLRIQLTVLLTLLVPSSRLLAQETKPQKNDGMEAVQYALTLASQGKPLAAIRSIENSSIDKTLASDMLATLYSVVGEWQKTHQLRSTARKNNVVSPPPEFRPRRGIDAIAEQAQGKRIVIINEAHDSPEHRRFIARLAEKLRTQGFRYYAFETLSEDAQQLKHRTYPVLSTGFYSVEPAFGQLIRDVLEMGYTPVSYEAINLGNTTSGHPTDPVAQINNREKQQCDNLMDKIFKVDAAAKLVLHVGHDHVMEAGKKAGDAEILWLAARLKVETGLDPLTIDQTTQLRRFPETQSSSLVFSTAEGQCYVGGHFSDAVDIQVYHPPIVGEQGRPSWMFADETRVVLEIPENLVASTENLLVQAFYDGEEQRAVPADQVVLRKGQPRPVLLLRPARYQIAVQDEDGHELSRTEVVVSERDR